MRLTKIYTKQGDKGGTQLATAEKVSKACPRIEAYGAVDELNSFMGLWADTLRNLQDPQWQSLIARIVSVQQSLFDLGGELSFPPGKYEAEKYGGISSENITALESDIDNWNESLPALKNFVLPGGHIANSTAHICRTICRRSERLTVALAEQEEVRNEVIQYLNRLSDWFFVASRHIAKVAKTEEILWDQSRK